MTWKMYGPLAPVPLGIAAPDFSLATTQHAAISLRSQRGQAVVVAFYPLDWEPVSPAAEGFRAFVSELAGTRAATPVAPS